MTRTGRTGREILEGIHEGRKEGIEIGGIEIFEVERFIERFLMIVGLLAGWC